VQRLPTPTSTHHCEPLAPPPGSQQLFEAPKPHSSPALWQPGVLEQRRTAPSNSHEPLQHSVEVTLAVAHTSPVGRQPPGNTQTESHTPLQHCRKVTHGSWRVVQPVNTAQRSSLPSSTHAPLQHCEPLPHSSPAAIQT